MALPGETILGKDGTFDFECVDCKVNLPIKICKSNAGYYVGTFCNTCGPNSRESGYYRTEELAQNALNSGKFGR